MVLWKTGIKFSSPIHPAGLYEKCDVVFLRVDYIIWGNRQCYIAKLKDNMIEIDGDIHQLDLGNDFPFTEAPWVHKHDGKYYLTYAVSWPERMGYAMSDNIMGPWKPMGLIDGVAGNSNTTHPSIVKFKDQWLYFTHDGSLHDGHSYKRSVLMKKLEYNSDGSIKPIDSTPSIVR